MPAPQGALDELRLQLGSPSATELPDAQLSSYLESGLRQLSRFRPREASGTLSLESGVSVYDLPAGVTSVRRLYLPTAVAAPSTSPGPASPIDSGVAGAMTGFSPALDWPIALDSRQGESRHRQLYGGDWYVEAGQIVIAPPPSEDMDVMYIYPAAWTWDDVLDVDGYGALTSVLRPDEWEDLLLYGRWKGFENLGAARRKLRAVSRLGQSTAFAAGDAEGTAGKDAAAEWKRRVERPRAGPIKG